MIDESVTRKFDITSHLSVLIYCEVLEYNTEIDHFTVVGLVTCPLNGSEAGVDLVLIQTSLFLLCKSSCSYAN